MTTKTPQSKAYRMKAVLTGKFIVIQSCVRKQKGKGRKKTCKNKSIQISNNPTSYLKREKKEQIKPKVSRRKEIIKIRAEITIEKISETKSWFFEKINKIDKL